MEENKNTSFKLNTETTDKENQKIEIRSKSLNIMADYYGYSAIKYTFTEEVSAKAQYLNSIGLKNNGIQICIVDATTINFDNVMAVTQEVAING